MAEAGLTLRPPCFTGWFLHLPGRLPPCRPRGTSSHPSLPPCPNPDPTPRQPHLSLQKSPATQTGAALSSRSPNSASPWKHFALPYSRSDVSSVAFHDDSQEPPLVSDALLIVEQPMSPPSSLRKSGPLDENGCGFLPGNAF